MDLGVLLNILLSTGLNLLCNSDLLNRSVEKPLKSASLCRAIKVYLEVFCRIRPTSEETSIHLQNSLIKCKGVLIFMVGNVFKISCGNK